MDYKEEFEQLIQEKRYEDARILLEKNHIYALEDPFYYANMGWILNQMERYEEAIICLKKGLQLFPGDGWMFSQIAYANDRLGNLDEGLHAIHEAFDLGFDEPWLHGEMGWCYKEMREYDKAINCFEDALMDDENNVWPLAQAAYTYLAMEKYDVAEEYFKKCYLLQPSDDSIFDLVHFYKTVADYEKVIECLQKECNPQYEAWKHFEMGSAYFEMKNFKEALSHLEYALACGRDDTGIRTLLGDVYAQLHQKGESIHEYDVALEYYEKALKRDDQADREWVWQEMIWIAHKEQDFEKKLEYLDRASKEYPNNLWMQYHYARCYSDLNQYELAANACERCLSLGEKGKEMQDLYAWNLGRCGKEQEAIDVLNKRIEEFGADEWNYGELGWDYAQLRNYDYALSYFERAYEMNPDSAMHASMIGWCYLRKQNYEQALEYLNKAKKLGRMDGWLASVFGETYQGMNEDARALEEYEYAFAHGQNDDWIKEQIVILKQVLNKEKAKG